MDTENAIATMTIATCNTTSAIFSAFLPLLIGFSAFFVIYTPSVCATGKFAGVTGYISQLSLVVTFSFVVTSFALRSDKAAAPRL